MQAARAIKASASAATLKADPAVARQAHIEAAKSDVMEQAAVIDGTDTKLAAVQRNYEALSKAAAEDRKELERLRAAESAWQATAEQVRADSLKALEGVMSARCLDAAKHEEDIAAEKARSDEAVQAARKAAAEAAASEFADADDDGSPLSGSADPHGAGPGGYSALGKA